MSRLTGGITALVVVAAAGLGVAAPVPPDAPPDPLGKGYLGITVRENGLVISAVQPNTPAARAGLHDGDKIVRVGGVHPQAFEQVITTICSYRPGATVEVEVERGSERKVFRVTLTVRDPSLDSPSVPIFPPDE